VANAARYFGPGTEFAAGAGNDDGADIVVAIGAFERMRDLGAHLAGIGIQLVGPVERDGHDRTVEIAVDMLVAHRIALPFLLFCGPPIASFITS
jgi:hypothetical protein